MAHGSAKRRIWGWCFFDWASQPYNTLLITFIFGPYVKEMLGSGTAAQTAWGYGVGAAGILIALLAPVLGAIADRAGGRMRFIWLFSLLYFAGAWGLWWAAPGSFHLPLVLLSFGIGLIGMEFATIFTNAMLPDLGPREEIGRISGSGWAFGYLGGVLSLAVMLVFFAESATTGKTLIGIAPVLGLDAAMREGTRAVGPFTALWFAVFMVPFFLWVREPRHPEALTIVQAVRSALPELRQTLRHLPDNRSLFAYLGSSMFYRDALNGMYAFGGIYAAGVLEWSVVDVGIFGIIAAITGAVFAWLGGRADARFGPKPVIFATVLVLTGVAIAVVFVSRSSVLGIAVPAGSALPDIAFYILGALIGGAGGALQSASRTMMVHQAPAGRVTEAFGLYALAGKATSFVAPISIGIATDLSGSQQLGITPLIALFLIGLFLLLWVKPEGERAEEWSAPSPQLP
ncbi:MULTISPECIES: MFS transporter [Actibacterium]|uniref:UMF1 family MFS transporter n=1 Tax=Actibacterium naphthalenivorans TaxID=1614693 RepID=A0A840C684_9RHOB|nr:MULTISPECIES: MFS transporter [Actibacterium]ALG89006.1 MFS transporter [Actibacterium sp. EMB200-NS6]MBB4021441.1 UMF1 family MFS transporter [Actibacterium naphthalenivorans]